MNTHLQAQYHALEAEGFCLLGIAWKPVPLDHPHALISDETEWVLAGFAAFLAPQGERGFPTGGTPAGGRYHQDSNRRQR